MFGFGGTDNARIMIYERTTFYFYSYLTVGDSVNGGSSGELPVVEADSPSEGKTLPVTLNDLIISWATGSKSSNESLVAI